MENGFDLIAARSLGRFYLKRILLALFADRNLSPHCKHDVLTGVSKGFNRIKQVLSLPSSVLDNLDDGKIKKKMSDKLFNALFNY